ncbi:hypothetical protein DFH29DRAFT_1006068 [Suillus ampliporus]|nr:hypothetical protein DFH29DRAFT_1006068 [Suillus ampliporus]
MDFARLDSVLNCITLKHGLTGETLNGIPCIIGGLSALLGTLDGQGGDIPMEDTTHHFSPLWLHSPPLPREYSHACEQDLLADALRTNSITVQHITTDDAHQQIMTFHEPIIFGEAPEYDSQNLHGRCAFLNGRIDRKGLPRLTMAETSPEPPSEPSLVLSPPAPSRQLCRRKLQVLSPEDSPVVC